MKDQFEQTRMFLKNAVLKGQLVFPNEHVIRFVKRHLNKKPYAEDYVPTVLDFGCGLGRDSVAVAGYGLHVIAMDYNAEALEVVKQKIAGTSLNIDCVQNSGFEVPIAEASVDIIFADGSLFYCAKADLIRLLKNLRNVLKPGGLFWASWRTKTDTLFGEANQIGDGLYVFPENNSRFGCTYFFADENDIREMYEAAALRIKSLDLMEYTENDRTIRNSWWHVIATR